jgi:hypothetical protein
MKNNGTVTTVLIGVLGLAVFMALAFAYAVSHKSRVVSVEICNRCELRLVGVDGDKETVLKVWR